MRLLVKVFAVGISWLLVVSAHAQQSAATTPSLDIVGLRIGITEDQAINTLKAFDPKIAVITGAKGGRQFTIDARRSTNTGAFEIFSVAVNPLPGPILVLAISRTSENNTKPPIVVAELIDGVVSKYGKPAAGSRLGPIWFFDKSYKSVPPPSIAGKVADQYCRVIPEMDHAVSTYNSIQTLRANKGGVNKKDWEDNIKVREECGTVLTLYILAMSNQELARGFKMALVDHPSFMRAVVAAGKYSTDKKRTQDQQEVDKVKQGVKPRL